MNPVFDIDDFIAQLEKEKAWRQLEVRALESVYIKYKEAFESSKAYFQEAFDDSINSQQIQKDICLKSLFVMLHAHLEGFFKTAVEFYALQINNLRISCKDANEFLGAATLFQVFVDLEQGLTKDPFFRGRDFPADDILHKTYRRAVLVRDLSTLHAREVNIPTDQFLGPQAKFTSDDAQRILHLVGFSHQAIKNREGTIKQLAYIRNHIAHGSKQGKITEGLAGQYDNIREEVFKLMDELIILVKDALQKEQYKTSMKVIETTG